MKRTLLLIIILTTLVYKAQSQEYKEHLNVINNFLETFDNGYYGPLSVDDVYLYCNIKGNRQSKIIISEISKANVVTPEKEVKIQCKNDNCVTGVTGDMYDSLTFRTDLSGFDTAYFTTLLNLLIDSLRER